MPESQEPGPFVLNQLGPVGRVGCNLKAGGLWVWERSAQEATPLEKGQQGERDLKSPLSSLTHAKDPRSDLGQDHKGAAPSLSS